MKRNNSNNKKNIKIKADVGKWNFNGNVPQKFEEHIAASVPLYHEGHKLIKDLSYFFLAKGSICYDIGSSTGKLIHNLATDDAFLKTNFIGLDKTSEMVKFAKNKFKKKNCKFYCKDIINYNLKKSDLIISYYTIQFINPSVRQIVLSKIYESLNWGGAFIMFEKVRAPDARFQDITTNLYNNFKIYNGFNTKDIFNKSNSLKGVLEPFSTNGNLKLLQRAGFVDILSICKYISFEGFLAIK